MLRCVAIIHSWHVPCSACFERKQQRQRRQCQEKWRQFIIRFFRTLNMQKHHFSPPRGSFGTERIPYPLVFVAVPRGVGFLCRDGGQTLGLSKEAAAPRRPRGPIQSWFEEPLDCRPKRGARCPCIRLR